MRVDPLRFAVLFPALLAAHTVGDHVVQTDAQAASKSSSWRAMAGHVAGYQLTQAAAVVATSWATRLRPSWPAVIVGGAFSAASHAFLDRRWPVTRLLEATGSRSFARPSVTVRHAVDGYGRAVAVQGVPTDVVARGPLPLHGPYLADQALHTACLLISAAIMAVRR